MDGSVYVCILKLLIEEEYNNIVMVMPVKQRDGNTMLKFEITSILYVNRAHIIRIVALNICGLLNRTGYYDSKINYCRPITDSGLCSTIVEHLFSTWEL
jgi:hypothetical protein